MKTLPSPNQLKNKIIIKAKKPKHNDSYQKAGDVTLFDLVNICQSVSFESFSHSREKEKFHQMASLKEGDATELMEASPEEFIEHTQERLVRIYPASLRTSSSNFSPFAYWGVGCQIVALNYQTNGCTMRMYHGRFRQNGNCGYVLKPPHLLQGSAVGSPSPSYLRVEVVSAQNLPRTGADVTDPYVSLKIRGHPDDDFKWKTKSIANNGFNPRWDESVEALVKDRHQAVVCFTVKDKRTIGSAFVGSYALPFNSLTPGYRNVPLIASNGQVIPCAKIFVHIQMKELVD